MIDLITLLVFLPAAVTESDGHQKDKVLFFENFENGLDRWEVSDPAFIRTKDSNDPQHNRILELSPHDTRPYALIRGSEEWSGYRVEGSFLFPDNRQNYLGFIYNLVQTQDRVDLGSIYIKGNGSYIRANPRRDWNPLRSLYEEWRVDLKGDQQIRIGHWHRFAAEVVGNVCHFYVGHDPQPKVTFDLYEIKHGKTGFKPRVVGGPVWLDDVTVTNIDALSYKGPNRPPGLEYRPEELVTDWHVLGPLTRAYAHVENSHQRFPGQIRDAGRDHQWTKFETDARGAVVTGRITEFTGSRTVAYFSTTIHVSQGEQIELHVSTIDDLAAWVNGKFEGYYARDRFAWHDFGRNPIHPLKNFPLILMPGDNQVLFRVRGGVYASGGFFARPVTQE